MALPEFTSLLEPQCHNREEEEVHVVQDIAAPYLFTNRLGLPQLVREKPSYTVDQTQLKRHIEHSSRVPETLWAQCFKPSGDRVCSLT